MNFSSMQWAEKFLNYRAIGKGIFEWEKKKRKNILLNLGVGDERYGFMPCWQRFHIGGMKRIQPCFCVYSILVANSVACSGMLLSWEQVLRMPRFNCIFETQDYATSSAKCAGRQCMMPRHLSLLRLCTWDRLPLKQGTWAAYMLSHVADSHVIESSTEACLVGMKPDGDGFVWRYVSVYFHFHRHGCGSVFCCSRCRFGSTGKVANWCPWLQEAA